MWLWIDITIAQIEPFSMSCHTAYLEMAGNTGSQSVADGDSGHDGP
jgi:hypothetical protein